MNIYFYSRQSAYCRNDCTWFTCPRRCIAKLREIPVLGDMVVISGTLDYSLPLGSIPRSGDLMLLFAATWHELEELIAMRDAFDGLRILLVTGMPESKDDCKLHLLRPRYITSTDKGDIIRLGEVVSRMVEKTAMAA